MTAPFTTNLPLVSIITPSFIQGQFIEETISSALNQDSSNIEYITIEVGFTQRPLDILKKYKDRLTSVSEPDTGQSDAMNKGCNKATASIIRWANSLTDNNNFDKLRHRRVIGDPEHPRKWIGP